MIFKSDFEEFVSENEFSNSWHFDAYIKLINSRLLRPIVKTGEWHHIVPRSFNGSNERTNLIKLTFREHFVAHLLLSKSFVGRKRHKMGKAIGRMTQKSKKIGYKVLSSAQFDLARSLRLEAIKGIPLSEAHRKKLSESMTGVRKSETHVQNMRIAQRNRDVNPFQRAVEVSAEMRRGISLEPEHRKKVSEALTGVQKSEEHKRNMKKPKSPRHVLNMRISSAKRYGREYILTKEEETLLNEY
jgi:hypothetical protein